MMRGPIRNMALGGVAFGAILVVVGVLFFLSSQGVIQITLNFWAVCGIGLILFGIVVIGGVLYGRRMMRGGWRRWAEGWDEGWRREPPAAP